MPHGADTQHAFSCEARRLDAKRTDRRTHFFHAVSKHIVSECVERGVGTLVVSGLGDVREDENGDPTDRGDHGDLDLHGWAFDRLTSMLEYKGEAEGIEIESVSEREYIEVVLGLWPVR